MRNQIKQLLRESKMEPSKVRAEKVLKFLHKMFVGKTFTSKSGECSCTILDAKIEQSVDNNNYYILCLYKVMPDSGIYHTAAHSVADKIKFKMMSYFSMKIIFTDNKLHYDF